MSTILNRIKSAGLALSGRVTRTPITPPTETPTNAKEKKKTKAVGYPNERQRFRSPQDILTLENAIAIADGTTKDRELLHQIYRQVVLEDSQVISQWQNRKFKTIRKDWGLYPKNSDEKDDAATALLNKQWFFSFIEKALDAEAWGYVAIELANWDRQKQSFEPYRNPDNKRIYSAAQVIDHDYVKPEFGIITKDSSSTTGLDIYELSNQLIYSGDSDHGFLYRLAKPCLFKANALANWSEWIEVFGLDAIVAMSGAEGADRTALLSTLRQIGSSRVGVLDEDDKLETIGSNKTDAYRVFEVMARYTDEAISKIILGQDVVSNNTGQVVGNVGENVANDYAGNDAKGITYLVNDYLIPLLKANGYLDLTGYVFAFDESASMRELKERADIDEAITRMGFFHDPEQINERYGVNVEVKQMSTIPAVEAKLKSLYKNG
jgi:phage gp29-like protein